MSKRDAGSQGADADPSKVGRQFLRAATIRVDLAAQTRVLMIGCGGTGGWLAPALARIAFARKQEDRPIDLYFVDPDTVEEKNLIRQNFCEAEVGRPKAETLALRYGGAWGLDVHYMNQPFNGSTNPASKEGYGSWRLDKDELMVLVGCVDNAAARSQILESVKRAWHPGMAEGRVFWLDCGNSKDAGQVLLGNAPEWKRGWAQQAFPNKGSCIHLPAPSVQEPSLLVPLPEEKKRHRLSCAELAARNAQSLAINQRVAAEAANMLTRLLVTGDLKYFATYFDLDSGASAVKYATPDVILETVRETR